MIGVSWLLVSLGVVGVRGVSSPLDKVTQEVFSMRESLGELEVTLLGKIHTIQGQLTALDVKLSSVVEPRLASLDVTLTGMEDRLAGMDTHSQMSSHLLALREQVTQLGNSLQGADRPGSRVDTMCEERGGRMMEQVEGLDKRVGALQSSMEEQSGTLTSLLTKVEELGTMERKAEVPSPPQPRLGHRRHRGRQANLTSCTKNRQMLHNIERVAKEILEQVKDEAKELVGPKFEYLRSEESQHHGDPYWVGHENNLEEGEIFKKISVPFKRVNRRLTELKMEMQTSNEKLQKEMTKYLDISTEQKNEQTHMLEGQAASLASLQQCCTGQATDQARLSAQAGPVLDRLDRWMTSWQNSVVQQFERVLQQNSYDHDSHSKGHKELEKLMVEGFDRCQAEAVDKVRIRKGRVKSEQKLNDQAKSESEEHQATTTRSTTALAGWRVEVGCEDPKLVMSGASKVYRVGTVGKVEDYHTRYCDQQTNGGGWTIIQRRGDFGGTRENFTRSWEEYSHGFGDMDGEFWWGNEHLSRLTKEQPMVLRVELESHDGQTAHAEYSTFRVDGADTAYQLWVGGYTGNASDSLSAHNGFKFSTVDKNNDEAPTCCPCAPAYGGGWWFYSCFESNLNGEYFGPGDDNGYYRGIIWELWLGDYSLKSVAMMVRPQDLAQTSLAPLAGLPPDP